MQALAEVLEIDYMGSAHHNTEQPAVCMGTRGKGTQANIPCTQHLSHTYKFYMALENSDCQDYITEKMFKSSLLSGMVPLVC